MIRTALRKSLVTAAAVLCLGASLLAKTATPTPKSYPASDPKVAFVGRTLVEGDNVSFNWTGVYARISFTGNYLAMKVSDTKKNYYNIWLDKSADNAADKLVTTFGSDSLVVLIDEADMAARYGKKVPAGPHSILIRKRTEGEQGTTTIHSFITNGELVQAEPLKSRMIEFIGDSYTCGYGTEGLSARERFRPDTENSNYSYAAIVSRYFDADCYVIAHSGRGIARNYNDGAQGSWMPELYNGVMDESNPEKFIKWDAAASDFKPAMTIILLGTNDFSVRKQPVISLWKSQYLKLLKEIKANYGNDHPILCCAAKGYAEMYDYVRAAVEASGMKNVTFMGHGQSVFAENEYGSDGHPNYQGHRKYAHAIIPYVSTITGWPMKDDIR